MNVPPLIYSTGECSYKVANGDDAGPHDDVCQLAADKLVHNYAEDQILVMFAYDSFQVQT